MSVGIVALALSYRDLEQMMVERGIEVDYSTINRWVLKYAPELDKRIRPHLQSTNDSWRVDETYIKAECRRGNLPHEPFLLVKGQWRYLYQAVDSEGNTLPGFLTSLWELTKFTGLKLSFCSFEESV